MPATYSIGTKVKIIKGRYAGQRGTVWMVTKAEVGVDFDKPFVRWGDSNATVRQSSIIPVG